MTRPWIGGLSTLALVLAAAGCGSADHPALPAAPAAAASPAAAPTVIPTATPSGAVTQAPLTATASISRKRPFVGTKVGVAVFTTPGARITVVAHFLTGDRKKSARADATGAHTFWFPLGSAAPGYRVKVSVRVTANGQKLSHRVWFIPRQRPPPPVAAPAPAPSGGSSPSAAPPSGCYPKTDSGNCYEPGEFCRTSDHGVSGVAGNGEAIICEDNNGWRWKPA